MYIRTSEGLGQTQLPSKQGTPCWQDAVPANFIDNAILAGSKLLIKNLTKFHLRDPKLRTWHKIWIKDDFVPAIVKSWQTTKPIRTIILTGHADTVGNQLFNYNLGLKRAKAVRERILKVIKVTKPDLLGKINIKVFSQGECWPLGEKARLDRWVSVVGMNEIFSSAQSPAPAPPPTPSP